MLKQRDRKRRRRGMPLVVLLLVACGGGAMSGAGAGMGPVPTVDELTAVEQWQVVQLPGIAMLPDSIRPTMQFSAEMRVAGRNGCNQYNGPFDRSDGGLTFGAMVATRMACPGQRAEVESAFTQALQNTRSASLTDGALSLLGEEGTLLARLVPAAGT